MSSPTIVLGVVGIALALHGVTNLTTSWWKPAEPPNIVGVNTEFCSWRMNQACWASPNASLGTFELLFPVTRQVLLQRQIVHHFQPLETRYDGAVVWNAMSQCRRIRPLDVESIGLERSALFASLPSNSSVDAWCGASLLSGDEKDPQAVVWMLPSDAMVSPFAAHKTAFLSEAAKREHQERVKMRVDGFVVLACALALFLCRGWLVSWWSGDRTARQRGSFVVNPRAPEQITRETTDLPTDPTWIDLQAPAHE